jgi:8-oxo-dGTP pyrophosphatase MutT (NUDIX family)
VPVAVRARRLGYRLAHAGLVAWWTVRRPHTRGVKCVLRRDGEILFVRHTYGEREAWELPGGGLHHGEPPADAAAREAREELGVDLDWRGLGVAETGGDGKTTTLYAFTARLADGAAVRVTPVEIADARWAPADDPPEPLGRDVAVVLELLGPRGAGTD